MAAIVDPIEHIGGAELSTFGLPHMDLRHNIIRLTARLWLVAVFTLAFVTAKAQTLNAPLSGSDPIPDPAQSPLSDNYAWEKDVVENRAASPGGPTPAVQSGGAAASTQPASGPQGSGDTPSNSPAIEDASA